MLSQEMFILGLFSVLDVILDQNMEEALKLVRLPKSVNEALLYKSGKYAQVYEFMLNYEKGNWQEVSRQLILNDISLDKIYQAYTDALIWYRKLILGK